MSSADFEPLTREDVLDGLYGGHTQRASTLLLAIESRTAHLAARSKQAMERFLTEEAAEERELAFLEALALGREPSLRPTIQDLEHYATQWASLVPENPRMQAAVAHLLGQKYQFTQQAVPGIRAALGLDTEAVEQAYQRLYDEPLETIFALRTALADRLRWAWTRLGGWLESLPPFWAVFSMTLTETVGAGILALPIALADVGPLAGVLILVAMGLINVLTIAYMAEAVARSGTIRYGSAFIGRIVNEYLGRAGSFLFLAGLTIMCILTLWPMYIGFAATLEDATSIPAPAWVALLFLTGLYYLRRQTLDATIASAFMIGVINISLILLLALLAFTRLRPENLSYVNVPFLGGRPFQPSILQLIFGVILLSYFGHLSVSNCAQVVLHRDPSARSLIWGAMVAQVVVMVIYSIWVLAVNGAIAPQALAGHAGTALTPLAAEIGPIVHVLGSAFAVLGMGIGTIHSSLGLFNMVREWLPTKRWSVVMLPQRRGRLFLHSGRRGMAGADVGLRLGLTYLGLGASSSGPKRNPRFRMDVQVNGVTQHLEMSVSDSWEATALFERLPALRQHGLRLALEILEANQEHVRLRVSSPLRLTYEGEWYAPGLSMADVLALPDAQLEIITWMTREAMMERETVSLAQVATETGQPEPAAREMLKALVEQGIVQELEVGGKVRYQPRLVSRRGRQLPEEIWQALGEKREAPLRGGVQTRFLRRAGGALLGERGRFLLSMSPVAAVFLLTEWLLLTGRGSFAEPLSFLGVIAISLLGGTFPVLLLLASRRKGEMVPGVVYRFLSHPLLMTGIYLLSLANLFLHGLVIWEDPVQRVAALAVGLLMLGATIAMVRRGALARRLVVELRQDQRERGRAAFAITAGGQPATGEVRLGYPDGERKLQAAAGDVPTFSALRYAHFQLPATQARELKVWAHKITTEGDSEGLPALLEVYCDGEKKEFDLYLLRGQALLPLDGQECRLKITLSEPSVA